MNTEEAIRKVTEYCLAKPGAYEDHPWGDVVFKVAPKGKMFCCVGSESPVITVKSSVQKQAMLVQHPNIEIAAYVGRYGWVTVNMRDEQTFELGLELIDESYEAIAGSKKKAQKA